MNNNFTKQVTEEPLILGKAKVINIDDPLKKGRVQIRLLPEMENAKESYLPWYEPWFGTGNNVTQKFHPPMENSIVLVYSTGTSKRSGYYLAEDHIQGFFDITKITSKLSSVADTTYKNLYYTLLASGNILYENRNTKETGILHSSGSYFIFDSSGKMTLNSSLVTITGGDFTVDGSCIPDGTGAFCGLPTCLFTGSPQTGKTITGT